MLEKDELPPIPKNLLWMIDSVDRKEAVKLIHDYTRTAIASATEAASRNALEDAANKFDGATAYNWTAADGYANAFDIATELRYMAAEVSNAFYTPTNGKST